MLTALTFHDACFGQEARRGFQSTTEDKEAGSGYCRGKKKTQKGKIIINFADQHCTRSENGQGGTADNRPDACNSGREG